MSEAIHIEGLAEFSELLSELTPQAAKRYLSLCAEPAAQVVLDAMGETVPIGVGVLEEQLGWQKKWGTDGDQTTMDISIGPLKPAFWGSLQEFGTSTQPAQHWFGNAWESSKEEVLKVFTDRAAEMVQRLKARKS